MHIPENYLSPVSCGVLGAIMIPIWRKAINKIKSELPKKKLPLMGIGAAFSFLVMMFNIPLIGGTTGHAIGATMVAILIGPYAACISITIALVIQALLFGDGGILAIGANCFNMAFIAPFVGYYIFSFIDKRFHSNKIKLIGVFISAYVAINVAALFAALEFGIQPILFKDAMGLPLYCPYSLVISIPAMLIPHLLVGGVLEGIITVGVYSFIKKTSPNLIYDGANNKPNKIFQLIFVMILLSPLGLLAKGTAWGEWGKDEINSVVTSGKVLGFVPKGMEQGFSLKALIPDYNISSVPEYLGYILSAILGVSIIIILFKIFNRKNNTYENK